MQFEEILDLIIEFVLSPIFLFALAMIIVVVAVRRVAGSRSQSGVPVLKQMRRMVSEVDKEKEMAEPVVQSRQDIITKKFNSQMVAMGLEPATDSGYVPVSHTPLARFLKDRGVHEDTVSAILAGLMEEEGEAEVRAIIDAAADTPGVDLTGEELAKAQDLAVIEWTNVRRSREA
ncbi:MAG: hypothetical protein ACXACG_04005 [Candidatus Thorarchaeota archaeon]|jgi:hypothetical protein